MKKISKTVGIFSLMVFSLVNSIQVKAVDVKNARTLFQGPKTVFLAEIVDEKGKKMDGVIARIKGREEQKLNYGQTSQQGRISMFDYPTNAIIVISNPGYVTQEIKTATLLQPKKFNAEEMRKCTLKIKMVPEKKGSKPAAAKKKKA